MKCWNCGFENPPNAKFCNNCGQAQERACPNCGTKNTAGAKFCSNCGTNLQTAAAAPSAPTPAKAIPRAAETPQALIEKYMPKEIASKLEAARSSRSMEGERRIVTILFCDVKGSTAMAEKMDPEEWADIMNRAFKYLIEPVYRYEGTVSAVDG